MYFAIGVEPTKDTASTPGWSRSASTASLSPWTTLNTPSGRPASLEAARPSAATADGTFSEGLRTNVLPQAIATGNIHIGTIAGKLNGVMPAHTPTGWRSVWLSTPVPTFSRDSPLSRCGMPQRELDHLDAALHRALGVGQRLAVLLGDDPRELLLVAPPAARGSASARARGAAAARRASRAAPLAAAVDRGVDVGGVGERHVADDVAGRRIGDLAVAGASTRRRPCRRSTAAAVRAW